MESLRSLAAREFPKPKLTFDDSEDDQIAIYYVDSHQIPPLSTHRMDSPRLNYVYMLVFLVSLNIISTYSAPPPR